MGKPKLIDVSQLPALLPEDRWERFQGLQDAMPKEIHVPDEKLHHATMSGSQPTTTAVVDIAHDA